MDAVGDNRRRWRTPLKIVAGLLVLLVVLAGAGVLVGYLWLRSSLPQKGGEIVVDGPTAAIQIHTDMQGVPRLRAATAQDGAFGLGFVHAQDRFFQMDLARRFVRGRLSELFGKRTLDVDRYARRLGFAALAAAEIDVLDEASQEFLARYCDGVNAGLAHEGTPWELRLLGVFNPEPWVPMDTACIVIYMDDWLAMDGGEERRWSAAQLVGSAAASWLMDVEPADSPTIVSHPYSGAPAYVPPSAPSGDGPGNRPDPDDPARGSNSWAVDGRWTASGAPLLCNDTHLGPGLPALFYACEMQLPSGGWAGLTIPGAPLGIVATNGAIAWGVTTLYNDAIDYIIEQFAPGDSSRVRRADGWEPVTRSLELIDVKGSDPATVEILRTQRGPLIQFDGAGSYYTRQWVRESASGTIAAYFDLSSATTLEEAGLALSKWAGPGQNLVLADTVGVRGRVGYFPAGRWPRREGDDGRWPRLGSSVAAAPPTLNSQWPVLFDPGEGRIVTANNRVAFGPDGDVVSRYWPLPWRAWRIEERLLAADALDVDSMADIQMDPATIPSIRWAAWFRGNDAPPGASADAERAWQILASWDGRMVGGVAPTIYRTALQALPWVLFADDWPQGWSGSPTDRWNGEVGQLPLERATLRAYGILGDTPLAAAFDSLDTRDWFDDASTSQRESPLDCMAEALTQTVRVLRDRYGNGEEDWRWERHHTLTVRHPLSSLPIVGSLLRAGPLPLDGDRHAILANAARNQENLTVDSIPVMRMIFDLGDPSRSRYIVAGGQSGHVLSRWFTDQLPAWARGESFALYGPRGKTTGDMDVPASAGLRLVLRPASASNQP